MLKKLEEKKIDSFESNLVTTIYYLKNKDFTQAKIYSEKLKNQSEPGTIQNLLSVSLNNWSNLNNINDISSALLSLKSLPSRFENIKKIQEVFTYCHFDSVRTDEMYKKLTVDPNINYSRYYFFHAKKTT